MRRVVDILGYCRDKIDSRAERNKNRKYYPFEYAYWLGSFCYQHGLHPEVTNGCPICFPKKPELYMHVNTRSVDEKKGWVTCLSKEGFLRSVQNGILVPVRKSDTPEEIAEYGEWYLYGDMGL